MNCMKCGRETENEQIFCSICQAEMERYPVNPGTVVLLPNQGRQASQKKNTARRRPALPVEEQVQQLKKKVLHLRILVFVMLLLLAGMSVIARRAISELDIQRLLGQNYSTVETVPETTAPTETTDVPTT